MINVLHEGNVGARLHSFLSYLVYAEVRLVTSINVCCISAECQFEIRPISALTRIIRMF
jgi:hypothetical protein